MVGENIWDDVGTPLFQETTLKKGARGLSRWKNSLPGQSATILAQYSLLAMADLLKGKEPEVVGTLATLYIMFFTWPVSIGRDSCGWPPSHIKDSWSFTFLAKHSLSVPIKSMGSRCATPFSAKLIPLPTSIWWHDGVLGSHSCHVWTESRRLLYCKHTQKVEDNFLHRTICSHLCVDFFKLRRLHHLFSGLCIWDHGSRVCARVESKKNETRPLTLVPGWRLPEPSADYSSIEQLRSKPVYLQ